MINKPDELSELCGYSIDVVLVTIKVAKTIDPINIDFLKENLKSEGEAFFYEP
jgi:hypothetical protein